MGRCVTGCTCGRHQYYGRAPQDPEARFWPKVTVRGPDECHEWTGAVTDKGYGFMRAGPLRPESRWLLAHRFAWELANGRPVPDGKDILHSCDNPPCCNAAHLRPGTDVENAQDRAERRRGREHRPENRGESHHNAKLTEADVRAIIGELQRIPRRTLTSIAAEFGTSRQHVRRIMRRESWAHLWPA